MKPGEAKYATKRNKKNPTFGPRAALAAKLLGAQLMPWQQQVLDVALELNPNDPGAWRYPVVVVTVPRQAGKSFLLRAVMVDRMMNYNHHEILMTAQTGKDARKRWKQIIKGLGANKKRQYFDVKKSQGSEYLTYKPRDSYIAPFAPTPKSIHGDSLHLVTVDEAWAFDSESGVALETAINPTQLTVKDSQLWIVSTKGTSASAYLNELIRRGRESVNDPNANMAFFEWSADEEEAAQDPYSDITLAFHPAVGHTQTLDKIRSMAGSDLSAWRRSYLNLETAVESTIIDMQIWDSQAQDPDGLTPIPSPEHISLAFDIASDRSAASIAAAWKDQDGNLYTRIIKTAPDVAWLPGSIRRLAQAGYAGIYCDPSGPTRTIFKDLEDTGIGVTALSTYEYATSCQMFLDRARAGDITHDANDLTRAALASVVPRALAGVTAFDARKSPEPIDALRATAIALWACQQRAQEMQMF
nr:MAG TPA: Large Terminase [Caudoviricetes sp.]